MAPIRTALIGLSATAKTSWASGAHLPYLLSPRGRQRYRIVALLNSSADAARAAIGVYGLDSTVRAYGSPDELASDADVELVVCCTRVDRHAETVRPSVEAGKAVFVEWPLARDAASAGELVGLAEEKGGRTVVGLQGRFTPPVGRVREVIASGRIGRVLSSEVRAFGGTNHRDVVPRGLDYFLKREVGGNVYTIGFAHVFDFVKSAVGGIADVQGHFQLQRPDVRVRDPNGTTIIETVKSDVPDLITVVATLEESPTTQRGAQLLVRFRRGQPFPGEPPLVWTINGEKGEIRLVATGGTALNASATAEPVTIEVHDFDTEEVEKVEWEWPAWQEELPVVARNVGAVYEAFADGKEGEYPTFDDALALHKQLESIISGFSV